MTQDLIDEAAAPATPVVLNTAHARAMLRTRFAPPEWALMEEVAPATGGGTRYADAVAVNLWQSRGHAVWGFEIKVSRSDWLRELKQPEKAESVFRYCDHWAIVAPRGIVNDGELPPTWGLFELRESGLVAKVPAPRLDAKPIDRAFFASLMRRGNEGLEARAEAKQHTAIYEAKAAVAKHVQDEVERRTREHRRLEAAVAAFEKATGLRLDGWSSPPIATIRLAQRLERLGEYGEADPLAALTKLSAELERAAETVRLAVDESKLGEAA